MATDGVLPFTVRGRPRVTIPKVREGSPFGRFVLGHYILHMTDAMQTSSIDTILEDFEFLDDWEDRYRYVIELGRTLEPLSDDEHCKANKVEGCASQVWLVTSGTGNEDPVLTFRGDSDAHIVRGLIAILLALYSGRPASEIIAIDPADVFDKLGLREHLTRQRSNGLTAMVERVRHEARSANEMGRQPAIN